MLRRWSIDFIDLQINQLRDRLAEHNIKIEISRYALDLLANLGYDPVYGARPLKRVIQKEILNELSKIILAGKIGPEGTIVVDSVEDGKFVFYQK